MSSGGIGGSEVIFGKVEPTRKVESDGDYNVAFNATTEAYLFVFEHRRD